MIPFSRTPWTFGTSFHLIMRLVCSEVTGTLWPGQADAGVGVVRVKRILAVPFREGLGRGGRRVSQKAFHSASLDLPATSEARE